MRLIVIAALGVATAGVAQAQIQAPKNPYAISPPTLGSTNAAGTFKPYEGYQAPKPYQPYQVPPNQGVYQDGPFSPGGEARRERKAEAAERARQNGAFSPAGEARRERAQAKHNAAINPF